MRPLMKTAKLSVAAPPARADQFAKTTCPPVPRGLGLADRAADTEELLSDGVPFSARLTLYKVSTLLTTHRLAAECPAAGIRRPVAV